MLIRWQAVFVASLIAFITSCATYTIPSLNFEGKDSLEVSDEFCRNWSSQLDDVIRKYGVRDYGATEVQDYPYLRVDRFLASFSGLVREDQSLYDAWITAMVDLDQESRQIEINNLSQAGLMILGRDRPTIQSVNRRCSEIIKSSYIQNSFDDLEHLRARTFVPDDYSSTKRVFGLYSLLKIPFVKGIEDWHEEARDTFERYRQDDVESVSERRYVPAVEKRLKPNELAQLLSQRDALGRLTLGPELMLELFVTYAPIFTIEDSGDYDRIGAVSFSSTGDTEINTKEPTVYTHLTHTRFEGKILPQLVYVAWFSERPKDGMADILGGNLDGIMWRVTLDHDGMPLIFDSIHPCGCYHMFFPTERLDPIDATSKYTEWAFSPKRLDGMVNGVAVNITVQTKTHYIADVTFDASRQVAREYSFTDYNELRSIETSQGSRNLFGVNGIVLGSERGERFLFWPSGIESPGAMRQWGRHATAFVGRRHFDDVDLLDKYYLRR